MPFNPRVGLYTLALLLFLCGSCARAERGVPASEGIANFGRVDGKLMRGAQPDEQGIENLAKLGVVRIINLRMIGDIEPFEEAMARRLGIDYVTIPLPGLGAPDDASVARALESIESSPGPVFIHCEHGADRTGTIVACYRIRREGWTAKRALAEAKVHGIAFVEFGMKRYVRKFAAKEAKGIPVAAPVPAGR